MTVQFALLASQRLTDNPDGGGSMTSTIIPDNVADNLFGPISRINRANGNVSLRKAIAKALTADTKTFFGSHAIVSKPPANGGVSALMFATGSWTDERVDAVDRLESYLVQGPQTRLWAYGQQVAGQRSVLCYQPVTEPLPNIGETYVLVDQFDDPNVEQFVRLTSVANTVRTFIDNVGPYQLNVVTMGISEPLTQTFPGIGPTRFSDVTPKSLLCTTNAADAANYYGVQTLTEDVDAAATTCTLMSVFGQLVPSSVGETAITNATPLGTSALIAAAEDTYTETFLWVDGTTHFFASRPVLPGSLIVHRDGSGWSRADDGAGNIIDTVTREVLATIDYASGFVTLINIAAFNSNSVNLTYIPAGVAQQSPFTAQQPVTQSTRGYLYVQSLDPMPTPGSLVVSYRSFGRWYDLKDDGSGALSGAAGAGSGLVRFDTGVCTVTLGALPDIGSNVVFAWGTHQDYAIKTGDVAIEVPAVTLQLAHPAKPSTITITWSDGSTRTVTDDGHGALTGYGTGTVDYGSGLITLRPTVLPSSSAGFSVAYQSNPATTQNLTPSRTGSVINLTLSAAPIAPYSVLITYFVHMPASWPADIGIGFGPSGTIPMTVYDDGSGNLYSKFMPGSIIGTVNYTTGAVSFDPDATVVSAHLEYSTGSVQQWDAGASPPAYGAQPQRVQSSWVLDDFTAAFTDGDPMTVKSTAASASASGTTENFSAPAVIADLTPTTVEPIVPGSVRFTFANDVYVDRAGALYRSINHVTGAGIYAGSIDYTSGVATVVSWAFDAAAFSIQSLLTAIGQTPIGYLASRVSGQAVRPASFFIQANRRSDGTLITATADVDGNWSNTHMAGHIEVVTGFYSVRFGQLVLDSSLTTDDKLEPWYDPAAIDGDGKIWRPDEALPGTIKFSCVVETTLPLSASVLGLDPVRLPTDGRVPIIRPGNTLVFRNPLTFTMPHPLTSGQVVSLPRDSLESAVLYDADGDLVDDAKYTADVDAGTITMAGSLSLSGYTEPLVCVHAVADMVLCSDVDIAGGISFSPALVNAYPAASSFVSSALIADNAGNLSAGVENLFTQTTWNFHPDTLWSNSVQGTSTTAQFNDIDYPIEVLNRDTIKQRVALIFTSATTGNIAFEEEGIIGTFNTSTNVAPVNPATGNPYFVMDHLGFGTGWATGNAIRFNLRGAGFPVWFVRSVQAGTTDSDTDSFTAELRWDE